MADDGTGSDIHIPSFLISFLDAQVLKDCLAEEGNVARSNFKCPEGQKVIASLEWDLPHLLSVDFSLWSSSDSDGAFKKNFALLFSKLEGKAKFRPRYFLWDGAAWGCTSGANCANQCTGNGRYCNPDPDNNLFTGVSGKDVVEENLRELCVWEQASGKQTPELWWEYVSAFAQTCHPGKMANPELFTLACSEKVHRLLPGLDFALTQACVKKSWVTENGVNTKLDAELADRKNLKILQLPTVMVNGQLLRGGVTAASILEGLCAGFVPGAAPKICTCVGVPNTPEAAKACLNSGCPAGEHFCQLDRKCYSVGPKFDEHCTPTGMAGCREGFVFCPSLLSCVLETEHCPDCNDASKPLYCVPQKQCVSSTLGCEMQALPMGGGGTSSTQVLFITLSVVGLAGCGAYMFWKRQKARLHDDVKAILESYRALDSNGEDAEGLGGRRDNAEAATYI